MNKGFMETLKECAEEYAHDHALIQENTVISYDRLYLMISKKTEELKQDQSTCIGILGLPSIDWIVSMFASCAAGKRTVLLDPSMPKNKQNALIQATGVNEILPVNPGLEVCREYTEDEMGNVLFFTSGTTHFNKAVVLTQESLLRSAWNGQQMLPAGRKDRVLALLPMNHVFGFVCTLLWPLCNGSAVCIGRGLRKMMEDPRFYNPTIIPAVPSLVHFLLGTNALNEGVKTILIGAAPIDRATIAVLRAKHIMVSFGYGLSETSSGLAISVNAEDPYAMKLCPDTRIRIGEDGGVYVRTPCMMKGYYHNPEATERVLDRGELDTGDLGAIDDDGCLHIKGRRNEVLVLPNGEKIYCPEWEAKLNEKLRTETAIAEEHGKLVLHVVSDRLEKDLWPAVNEFNRQSGIGQKITEIRIRHEKLPRTITGKLQRWLLSQEHKEGENNND